LSGGCIARSASGAPGYQLDSSGWHLGQRHPTPMTSPFVAEVDVVAVRARQSWILPHLSIVLVRSPMTRSQPRTFGARTKAGRCPGSSRWLSLLIHSCPFAPQAPSLLEARRQLQRCKRSPLNSLWPPPVGGAIVFTMAGMRALLQAGHEERRCEASSRPPAARPAADISIRIPSSSSLRQHRAQYTI